MSLPSGALTWVQVVVAGVLIMAVGPSVRAETQQILRFEMKAGPIAPLPVNKQNPSALLPGTGLCAAYREAVDTLFIPSRDASFPNSTSRGVYNDGVNAFMDGGSTRTGDGPVAYQTLRKPFDLAAQKVNSGFSSFGDYPGEASGCGGMSSPGCPFPASRDANGSPSILPNFLSRYRGLFAVQPNLVGQWIHFGFTTNSAVSMLFYGATAMPGDVQTPVELISRQFVGGQADFRVTNAIKFLKEGLYAVEILHTSAANNARLELAWTTTEFVDFDEASGVDTAAALPNRARPFPLATPDQFFQQFDGDVPFAGMADKCQQCPRKFAGGLNQKVTGGNGCPACFACNEAAVCQLCNSPEHCGCDTCGRCPDGMPICYGDQANPMSLKCVECVVDTDCKGGQTCTADNKCVGFCPCCDSPLKCTKPYPLDMKKGAAKACLECDTPADCPDNGFCDRANGRCLPKAPEHNDDKDCGRNAVNCAESTKTELAPRPYCLNGEVCVQCRWDVDCNRGNYCRSGDCIPCTDDRHCGPSCGSCGVQFTVDGDGAVTSSTITSTPVCYAPPAPNDTQPAPTPTCVECITDAQCGAGGECDRSTHTCSKKQTCDPVCPPGLVCSGGGCVECINSSQCKCGQCTAGVCTKSCGDSSECNGTQCCSQETQTCTSGRCKPGLTAHGGALCCDTTAGGVGATEDPWSPVRSRAPLWTLLATLAMFAALRLRALRPGRRSLRSGE